MAGLIAIKNELKPLQDRFKKKIAQVQIPDERILNYWSEDYISEFGQENFEKFKKWIQEKGISREKLIEFFVTSGYSLEKAEVEAEKLILNLSRTLAKKVDEPDIRDFFRVIIDVITENKEDLSVDIEDILMGIDKVLNSQDKLLSLYSERLTLLSPNLFKSRDDVKDILKFKFVGREEELKRLHGFLKGDSKVMTVFGEGGSGKTRLLVEFAGQAEKRVYFVHPEKSFEHVRIEDAVLVLDDASKYKDFDKLVDFAVNPESWGSKNVKLIILNRNFFRKETVDRLKAKSIYCDVFDLGGADIAKFVKVNFGIEKVDEIILESGDNFFFASVIAEYFKESGEIDLLKALEYRIEKYIEDLRKEPGILPKEELAIYILSLIMPVDMKKDSEALKRIFDYDRFCVALESDLVKRVDDDYVIRPDPVGDYIRLKFMEEHRHLFDRYINDFLVYMPFRIAYNVATMLDLGKDFEKVSLDLLEGIWEDLNTKDFESLEYFDALIFFTGYLRGIVARHIEKVDISRWIKIAEKSLDELKIREKLALTCGILTSYYVDVKSFSNLEIVLNKLRGLYEEHKEKEIGETLAHALANAMKYYVDAKSYSNLETILNELRDLYEEHKEKEIREMLAVGLVNITIYYGEVKCHENLEKVLDELKILYKEHDEKEIRENFAKALYNVSTYYSEVKNFSKAEKILNELRGIYRKHEEKEIGEKLVMALVNVTKYYEDDAGDFFDLEKVLDELKILYKEHDEKEIRENFAKALYNVSWYYYEVKNFPKAERALNKLRKLHGEHKGREIKVELAKALYKAAFSLSGIEDKYLHTILEAYTYRYYLPEEPQRTHQESLETLAIDLFSNGIIELHAKGEEYLTQFMKTIQTYLTDETEFTLLMNEVTEKLPENIQKSVWKIIDRLNE